MSHPSVVILAAGKGTRMVSTLSKVLHRLAGKPLLRHVLDAARSLSAERIIVVYGHGGEAVPQAFASSGAVFVLQEPQLGTGHALQQALVHLPAEGHTLVLYGDVPLTRTQTLSRVLSHPGTLCLLTALLDDPTGYGRIIRNSAGKVTRIVEEKDASASEKAIREINTGILAAPNATLRDWLGKLTNHNAQGEYYLTDIVPLALEGGTPVLTETTSDPWEIQGVNSREQLAQLERRYQLETARALMAGGVTLADPTRLDIRGELTCSPDVNIDVGCVFEGKVNLGEQVSIGAHCVIKDSEIGPGSVIATVQPPGRRPGGGALPRRPLRAAEAGHDPRGTRPRGQLRGDEECHAGRGVQSQPPHLPGRCHDRASGEHRRRHHHLQL